jgi:hypothetical protein
MPEQETPFTQFITAVTNNGGKWWVEELLVRGAPTEAQGGTLSGAHVCIGAEFPNPLPGQPPVKQVSPPMPLSIAPDSLDLASLFPEALRIAMRDLEAARASLAATQAELATTSETLTETIATLTAERDAAASKITAALNALA